MDRRMFVAVYPPAAVEEHLSAHLDRLRTFVNADDTLRWLPSRSWHITCAFLPGVDSDEQQRLIEGLDELARGTAPVELSLAGVGSFTDDRDGHPLFIGVSDPTGGLAGWADGARAASRRSGTRVDGRRFVPHLTLARRRRGGVLTDWFERLNDYRGPAWTATEARLVESHVAGAGRHGPRYEVVSRHRFSG